MEFKFKKIEVNLRALENLNRIATHGSYSRVVDVDKSVSLSTLSMQMKALEAELGASLFDRSKRSPVLTPLGRLVAEQAGKIVDAHSALRALCSAGEELVGKFRLGFIESTSRTLLPGFLKLAQTNHPEASFEISTGISETLCNQVRNDVIDAAIVTFVDDAMAGLFHEDLFSEEMVLTYPHARADHLPFLHFRQQSGIGRLISHHFDELDIHPTDTIHLDSIEAILECVKLGVGFSLLPLRSVQSHMGGDHSVEIERLNGASRRVVMIVSKKSENAVWRPLLYKILLSTTDTSRANHNDLG